MKRAPTSGMSRNLSRAMKSMRQIDVMEDLRIQIASHMCEIASLFHPGAKVTVLVRRPGDDLADVVCTDDNFPAMLAMLIRCQKREEADYGPKPVQLND